MFDGMKLFRIYIYTYFYVFRKGSFVFVFVYYVVEFFLRFGIVSGFVGC